MASIIITRPTGQALRLGEMLGQATQGVDLIYLPLLSIIPHESEQDRQTFKQKLSEVDLVIFVSPNAIECGLRLLDQPWPEGLPLAVVGGGSVDVLKRHGISASHHTIYYPEDPQAWDSEGLWNVLQAHCANWRHQKILLVRGVGGREWLTEQMVQAGAHVYPLSTYKRVPLDFSATPWKALVGLDPNASACLVTSSEALVHLHAYFESQGQTGGAWMVQLQLICTHPRIIEKAKQLGFKKIQESLAGDDNLVKACQAWLKTQQQGE